ncbi:MAG: SMP-30/gluconolactonase/LRE family protein [Streptosporangiaceae bacterium]|nr:SMP-30/gluconolactonase/LRE family protein [Streptosporangiaceae bacterium]MBV9856932.1 SMP-30/gluconolactonase/LRE family protein [Streptosporangiaceae bacterium]
MAQVHAGHAIEPAGDVVALLGEGPYWDEADTSLLWVDIPAGLLHRTAVGSGETVTVDVGAPLSAALPATGGDVLLARRNQLVLRTAAADGGWSERVVAQTADRAEVRFNDASVDPAGRVWVGSMHTAETAAVGELYRLDPGGALTALLTGVTVSNGLGWSPDGSRMYYVDSTTRRIDMFEYYPAVGGLAHRQVFADLRDAGGMPDGLTVDADGCVWVAIWGGSALRRYTPAGDLDAIVDLPVSNPTSCAFGGAGLQDLYVTTAIQPLSEAQRLHQPLAGRLLRLRPGPAGLPSASTVATIPPDPSSHDCVR